MDKVVDKSGVAVVNTRTLLQEGWSELHVVVHHALSDKDAEVLIGLVERMAVKAVEAWAGV